LSTELMSQIKDLAERENRSKSSVVRILLREALENRKGDCET